MMGISFACVNNYVGNGHAYTQVMVNMLSGLTYKISYTNLGEFESHKAKRISENQSHLSTFEERLKQNYMKV